MIRPAVALILVLTVALLGYAPTDVRAAEAGVGKVDPKVEAKLLPEYVREIQTAISRNWMALDSARGVRCVAEIVQAPGGLVLGATIAEPCDATKPVRQSLLAAIRRAEPLPYVGFEPVSAGPCG